MFGNTSFGNTSFGNTTFGSGFNTSQNPAPPTGTTIRFVPPTGTDTVPKTAGNPTGPTQVTTKHQNISAMKEYESKSNDELRLEDYLANRKVGQPQTGFAATPFGAQQGATSQPGGSLFGNTNQASSSFGMFGNMNKPNTGAPNASPFQMNSPFNTNAPAAGGGLSLFNQSSQANTTPFGANNLTTPNKSIFGTPTVATTTTTSIFGSNNATANTSASGGLSLFGSQPQAGASPFGATGINNMNKPTSLFGAPNPATSTASIFGNNNATNTAGAPGMSLFGAQPQAGASPFGATGLNTMNKTTNLFGTPTAPTGTSSLFGSNNPQANTSGALGQNNLTTQTQPAFGQTQPAFGQPQTGFAATPFGAQQGATSQPGGSLFGNTNQASSSFGMFGNMNKPNTGAPNASPFQMNSPFNTNAPAAGGGLSLFNQSSQANTTPFGANNLTTPNKSIFGTPTVATTTTTSIFGSNNATANTSASGGLSLFGSQPQAGASPFGATGINNMNKPTSLFGAPNPATSTASIFGNNNATNTAGAPGMSLFGAQPQAGASPFGATGLNTMNKTTNLFGTPTAPTGTSSLFGSNNPQANTSGALGQNNLTTQTQPAFGQVQQPGGQPPSGLGSPEALMTRLKTLPYGETSLFLSDTSTSPGVGSLKFTTDPKTINQYKITAKTSVKLGTPSSSEKSRANSVLFDGLDDANSDDLRCAIDVFVPKRNIKKLDLNPTTEQLEGDS